ncbi:MAG: DUF211 domain-containing protein [Mariprofundaceae bacterium]|nr:DUF211 domain-containing protein [Mariprofundaceae bacterium]
MKRVVLDILKPHQPNALEFSRAIAETGVDYHVRLTVIEVDQNTESVQVEVQGSAVDFEEVQSAITGMGGSLHSIDLVEVQSRSDMG